MQVEIQVELTRTRNYTETTQDLTLLLNTSPLTQLLHANLKHAQSS